MTSISVPMSQFCLEVATEVTHCSFTMSFTFKRRTIPIQVLKNPEILRRIANMRPLHDVQTLSQVNSYLRHLIKTSYSYPYLNYAYDRLLRRYVKHLDALRRTMKITGAVISGSSALQFILVAEPWKENDLDLLSSPGSGHSSCDVYGEGGRVQDKRVA